MIAMKDICAFSDRVAELFKPDKIILFGSYAYGTPNEDSDVDLLVVMPHRGTSRIQVASKIRTAVPRQFPMDLLVRSPGEMRQRLRWNDFFLKEIVENGKVLFESSPSRMDFKGRRRSPMRAA